MARRGFGSGLREMFALFQDVVEVSAAVRAYRQPNADTLRRIGIDPDQFRHPGRH